MPFLAGGTGMPGRRLLGPSLESKPPLLPTPRGLGTAHYQPGELPHQLRAGALRLRQAPHREGDVLRVEPRQHRVRHEAVPDGRQQRLGGHRPRCPPEWRGPADPPCP